MYYIKRLILILAISGLSMNSYASGNWGKKIKKVATFNGKFRPFHIEERDKIQMKLAWQGFKECFTGFGNPRKLKPNRKGRR